MCVFVGQNGRFPKWPSCNIYWCKKYHSCRSRHHHKHIKGVNKVLTPARPVQAQACTVMLTCSHVSRSFSEHWPCLKTSNLCQLPQHLHLNSQLILIGSFVLYAKNRQQCPLLLLLTQNDKTLEEDTSHLLKTSSNSMNWDSCQEPCSWIDLMKDKVLRQL